MPLIYRKEVASECILGLWEISENYDSLFKSLALTPDELYTLNSFQNHRRKIEWLSVRVLMNTLAGYECRILYTEERKPYLQNNDWNISISHSQNLTSILMAKKKKPGIDLEYMSHKINKVAYKFIHEKEFISSIPEKEIYHLYIHWCAKEAIYKLCDKEDINFKENIFISPFDPVDNGQINALLSNKNGRKQFTLHYFKKENYIIVYCIHPC